jgi:hypothetical protein
MPFEMIHFRDSDKIIRRKKLAGDVKATLEYVHDALQGTIQRGELLRQVLSESGWRENGSLNILENRRYQFKGFKKGIALEGSFASFEYLLTGLARLQVGFDKKMLDAGILMLTSARSEKSSLGSSRDLAVAEVEAFYPTISMPVAIALFDLGAPVISDGYEEGGDEQNGISVPAAEREEDLETGQRA